MFAQLEQMDGAADDKVQLLAEQVATDLCRPVLHRRTVCSVVEQQEDECTTRNSSAKSRPVLVWETETTPSALFAPR
jgi:hypothetical protein